MTNVISDKLETQSEPVQNVTAPTKKVKKPLPSNNVIPLKKAKPEWEIVSDSLPKLRNIVERLSRMGYACFPAKDGSPLAPFKDRPGFTSDRGDWSGANMIAVRLDGALLLDIDGNKGKVNKDFLKGIHADHMPAKVQHRLARPDFDEPGDSEHFLFRAAGWNADNHRMCVSGELDEFVDLKTGNQLMYIKPGKSIFWHNLKPIDQLLPVPSEILAVMRKGGNKPTRAAGGASLKGFNESRWPELEAAINFLRENGTYNGGGDLERTEWLKILSALKNFEGSAFEDRARQLWEDVSIDADEAANKWASESQILSQWNAPIFMAHDIAPDAFPVHPRPTVTDADLDDSAEVTETGNAQVTPADNVQLSLDGDRTNKGELIRAYNTEQNARAILSATRLQPCINQMTGQMEMHFDGRVVRSPNRTRSMLVTAFESNKMKTAAIEDHCPAIAEETTYHPVVKALEGKEWDGSDRVSVVLDALNFRDPEYGKPVMRAWLRATLAAAHTENGFSSKLVPVLVGNQDAIKSNVIARMVELVPGCFTDKTFSPLNKDSCIHAASHWVQEWAEMDSLSYKNMPLIKAYISSAFDSFRRLYARHEERKPRQGTIIATANLDTDTAILKDTSGNVRFAVLEMGTVDIETVNSALGWEWRGNYAARVKPDELEQFWLQIKSEWLAGEDTAMPSALREKQAEVNRAYEAMSDIDQCVIEYLFKHHSSGRTWMTASEIAPMVHAVGKSRVVGKALKRAAELGKLTTREIGGRVRQYLWPVEGAQGDLDD